MDEARGSRKSRLQAACAAVELISIDDESAVSDIHVASASQMQWREHGKNGYLLVDIEMSPEREPRLQTLRYSSVLMIKPSSEYSRSQRVCFGLGLSALGLGLAVFGFWRRTSGLMAQLQAAPARDSMRK